MMAALTAADVKSTVDDLSAVADVRGGDTIYAIDTIAEDIIAAIRNHPTNPGVMALEDLARYQPRQRSAICTPYRAFRVCGFPPPSSGGVAVAQGVHQLAVFALVGQAALGRDALLFQLAPVALGAHLFHELEHAGDKTVVRGVGNGFVELTVPVFELFQAGGALGAGAAGQHAREVGGGYGLVRSGG